MVRRILGGLAAGMVVASAAAGQHPADPVAVEPGCAVCHRSHSEAASRFNLKLGSVQVWGVEGLGDVSQSCLRCHLTAAVRARQPELVGATATAAARLLGADLSMQHPVGRRNPWGSAPLSLPNLPGPRAPGGGSAVIECTTCHDPHARTAAVPAGGAADTTCEACHEAAAVRPGHDALACADCHRMHTVTAAGRLMLGPDAAAACRGCHVTPELGAMARSGPKQPVLPAHRDNPQLRRGRCGDCHAVHRPA